MVVKRMLLVTAFISLGAYAIYPQCKDIALFGLPGTSEPFTLGMLLIFLTLGAIGSTLMISIMRLVPEC